MGRKLPQRPPTPVDRTLTQCNRDGPAVCKKKNLASEYFIAILKVFHIIISYSGLDSPILVVDISDKEIEIAKHKQGVTALVSSVNDFLQSTDVKGYNKYLISFAVHHFPDQQRVFKMMYNCLPPGK